MRCLKTESELCARWYGASPSPGGGGSRAKLAGWGDLCCGRVHPTPPSRSRETSTLPLQGRVGTEQAASTRRNLQRHFAFALRQNRGLFQIQLALQAPPRFVGDRAVA